MVGIRWKDWNTMPTLRPRKRARSSSPSASSASPAIVTEPVSGRSSPAITISRVDLPEPDGPTIPIASPRPILSSMSLRICTRAAPRPSERLTPLSAMAAPLPRGELPFMPWIRRSSVSPPSKPRHDRSYGSSARPVQGLLAIAAICGLFAVSQASAIGQERPVRIVALGDSITTGLGLPANQALPARLQAALKAKGIAAEIADAGVSGDTAANGLARLDWAVPDKTDGVIVALGANDMLRGLDPALTRKALDDILRRLGERKIPVLLAGMRAAPNFGEDFGKRFETIYPELAAQHGVLLYPFLLDGVAAEAKLNQRDGIHPAAAGVDRIVSGILPRVEELVGQIRQSRRP